MRRVLAMQRVRIVMQRNSSRLQQLEALRDWLFEELISSSPEDRTSVVLRIGDLDAEISRQKFREA